MWQPISRSNLPLTTRPVLRGSRSGSDIEQSLNPLPSGSKPFSSVPGILVDTGKFSGTSNTN